MNLDKISIEIEKILTEALGEPISVSEITRRTGRDRHTVRGRLDILNRNGKASEINGGWILFDYLRGRETCNQKFDRVLIEHLDKNGLAIVNKQEGSTMNLSEAAVYLKCGYRIRRAGSTTVLVFEFEGPVAFSGGLFREMSDQSRASYMPTLEDLLATDWELTL